MNIEMKNNKMSKGIDAVWYDFFFICISLWRKNILSFVTNLGIPSLAGGGVLISYTIGKTVSAGKKKCI